MKRIDPNPTTKVEYKRNEHGNWEWQVQASLPKLGRLLAVIPGTRIKGDRIIGITRRRICAALDESHESIEARILAIAEGGHPNT